MNHMKRTSYILCGRRRETNASALLEEMLDAGMFWVLDKNLRIDLRCESKARVKIRKFRMTLRSSPELEARVTLLSAEEEPPVPYGTRAEDWFSGTLPRQELCPRLMRLEVPAKGESRGATLLRAMLRVIATTEEGKDRLIP